MSAVKELERERDDWKKIYAAYQRNRKDGVDMHSGKESRCGLCSKYRDVTEINGVSYGSCRTCPIVVLSGHTCAYWWRKKGITKVTDGKIAAFETYRFIDELIGG